MSCGGLNSPSMAETRLGGMRVDDGGPTFSNDRGSRSHSSDVLRREVEAGSGRARESWIGGVPQTSP